MTAPAAVCPACSPDSRRNEITLQNTPRGVTATFNGPGAALVVDVHGTNIVHVDAIAVLRACDDAMEHVAAAVRRSWPGWAVGVV